MTQQKLRRKRGVILTPKGLKKLQEGKAAAEERENQGKKYTLEAMSDRSGLAVDTLMKAFGCEAKVDKQTLQCCFRAFNLVLEPSDYFSPREEVEEFSQFAAIPPPENRKAEPELPGGPVPLHSPFYIERAPLEERCYAKLLQPGAALRIKAPRQMGKTSLMLRILNQARMQGYRTVALSLQLADEKIFASLDRFLQWFCASVGKSLGLQNHLSEYWDEVFGGNYNATNYFETYILSQIDEPLVLALDEVDGVFQHPEIAADFLALLRAWSEKSKYGDGNSALWQKLRLALVYSTEVSIPPSVNQFLFNVGLSVELPEFTREQVQDLVARHGLDFSAEQIGQLMAMVGGHPYRVRMALYHVWHEDLSLEQLLQMSPTSAEIYRDYLRRQFWHLQQYPDLAAAFTQVVTTPAPTQLDTVRAFKLESMGLVRLEGDRVTPSCTLYSQYFRDRLPVTC